MGIKQSFKEAFEKHKNENVSKVKYTGHSVNTINQKYKIVIVIIVIDIAQ